MGHTFFTDAFDNDNSETGLSAEAENCTTLYRCFLHILINGLRQGGGVGDIMKNDHWSSPRHSGRMWYDFLFFALMNIVFLNIVFGIIIDTFAELRDAKRKKEEDMHSTCFICGINADTFDKEGSGFLTHVKHEHNMWQYLYFMHHLRKKEQDEYTGQESFVAQRIRQHNLSFFPHDKCLSLRDRSATSTEEEKDRGTKEPETHGRGGTNNAGQLVVSAGPQLANRIGGRAANGGAAGPTAERKEGDKDADAAANAAVNVAIRDLSNDTAQVKQTLTDVEGVLKKVMAKMESSAFVGSGRHVSVQGGNDESGNEPFRVQRRRSQSIAMVRDTEKDPASPTSSIALEASEAADSVMCSSMQKEVQDLKSKLEAETAAKCKLQQEVVVVQQQLATARSEVEDLSKELTAMMKEHDEEIAALQSATPPPALATEQSMDFKSGTGTLLQEPSMDICRKSGAVAELLKAHEGAWMARRQLTAALSSTTVHNTSFGDGASTPVPPVMGASPPGVLTLLVSQAPGETAVVTPPSPTLLAVRRLSTSPTAILKVATADASTDPITTAR